MYVKRYAVLDVSAYAVDSYGAARACGPVVSINDGRFPKRDRCGS